MTKSTQNPVDTHLTSTDKVSTEIVNIDKVSTQVSGTEKDSNTDQHLDIDNGIALAQTLEPYFRPDEQTIVCGALDNKKIVMLAQAGVELIINLQPDDELIFDEAAAVKQAGMAYEQLPISGAKDLKQLNILAFDNILRQHHGKKVAMHCGSGNRVGAAAALRAGWLRGRKMDTAMARGQSHGLDSLEE